MTTVLVIGLDPVAIPGYDPAPVLAGLERSRARFRELGIEAHECLVAPGPAALPAIAAALRARRYDCVVVGGGIRGAPELLGLFEEVVNLAREHAPAAQIAFNTTPSDCADAVRRRIPAPGVTPPG
ncbi:hypothetical protein [Pseudonocardia sp. HH130630-07]|uniref:hypothetical protein n=1 Tax=Pseudonocardia sp. HH130630-07 TaxID=1690815 RepID=UPI000814D15F|nr:hypothetical protein [Pseudonocardia sp. HH130630-07]ANY08647.1 hypothetical protein AFB00_22930 [Pseudonocardia sp. HH130630-07]